MGANLSYPTVDLSDRVFVVTGGNGGIGYATAKVVAAMGAHTIIACRSEQKAEAAVEQMKQEIAKEYPDKEVKLEYMLVDLSSFRSVKDFTVAFREKNLPLHVLINNAAIQASQRVITDDGYETDYQVNHLSPFLLTLELLPIILDTAHACGDARIVMVSSSGHSFGVFNPENMNGEQDFGGLKTYCNSKLYNVMMAYALQRRLQNVGVTVSSPHPGAVNTGLLNEQAQNSTWIAMFKKVFSVFARDIYDGAATSLLCAVSPELKSQQCFYYADCKVKQSSAASRNESSQEQLWEMSIDAVKDYLSPEVLERYKLPPQQPSQEQSTAPPVTAETTDSGTPEQQDTAEETVPSTSAQETASS